MVILIQTPLIKVKCDYIHTFCMLCNDDYYISCYILVENEYIFKLCHPCCNQVKYVPILSGVRMTFAILGARAFDSIIIYQ